MSKLISYTEGLNRLLSVSKEGGSEKRVLAHSQGAILAEETKAPLSLPSFDNSAMDGFAVRGQDLQQASPESPVALNLIDKIFAEKQTRSSFLSEGETYKIMTGAPLPDGADSIIPIEQSFPKGNQILFQSPTAIGSHIRTQGSDIQEGERLLRKGQRLTAERLSLLAALGQAEVSVISAPRVALFTTGTELVEAGSPLQKGQIYNSNMIFLKEALKRAGGDLVYSDTVSDNPSLFKDSFEKALEQKPDFILSSGAVSMGEKDFIPTTVFPFVDSLLFHKWAVRPGKPLYAAQLKQGSLYLGLAGNPIATMIGFRFAFLPLLQKWFAQQPEKPIYGKLSQATSVKEGFTVFAKARWNMATQQIRFCDKQGSSQLSNLVHANGWALCSPELKELKEGSLVPFYPQSPIFTDFTEI